MLGINEVATWTGRGSAVGYEELGGGAVVHREVGYVNGWRWWGNSAEQCLVEESEGNVLIQLIGTKSSRKFFLLYQPDAKMFDYYLSTFAVYFSYRRYRSK